MSKIKILETIYGKSKNSIFLSGREGYWHNLSKTENNEFFKILEKKIVEML